MFYEGVRKKGLSEFLFSGCVNWDSHSGEQLGSIYSNLKWSPVTQQFYFSETALEKYSHTCTNRNTRMSTEGSFSCVCLNIYLAAPGLSRGTQDQHMGFSSLTRDRTQIP